MSGNIQNKTIGGAAQVRKIDNAIESSKPGGILSGFAAQLSAQNDPKLAPLVKNPESLLAAGQKAKRAP